MANILTSSLKAAGLSRVVDAENPDEASKCLMISFNRRPTDDELRALHEFLCSVRLQRQSDGQGGVH